MDPRREPALLILGLIAAAVQMLSAFAVHLTPIQQGTVNAVAAAILGVLTAIAVHSEQLAPVILGCVQALLQLGLAFGWHLSTDNQAVIMSFVAAIVAVIVRHIVTAPVPAQVKRPVAV